MTDSNPATAATVRQRIWSAYTRLPTWSLIAFATLLLLAATAWGLLAPIIRERQAIRRLKVLGETSVYCPRVDSSCPPPGTTWDLIIGRLTDGGTWTPDGLEIHLSEETPKDALNQLQYLRYAYRLRLKGTQWTDQDLAYVVRSLRIHALCVSQTSVTPDGWNALSQRLIQTLNVESSRLGPGFFGILRTMPQLESLSLDDCDLTDSRLEQLSGHLTMESMWLSEMPLPSNTARILGALPRLTRLKMTGTCIGDDFVSDLGHMASLTELSLANTDLTDSRLKSFPGHRRLEWLDLSGTAITEAGLLSLKSIPRNLNLMRTNIRLTEPLYRWILARSFDSLQLDDTMLDPKSDAAAELRKHVPQLTIVAYPKSTEE